jgi:hypothetical protein
MTLQLQFKCSVSNNSVEFSPVKYGVKTNELYVTEL